MHWKKNKTKKFKGEESKKNKINLTVDCYLQNDVREVRKIVNLHRKVISLVETKK